MTKNKQKNTHTKMWLLGIIPLFKLQLCNKETLKQQLTVKNKMQILVCFWFSYFVTLFWSPVFGSILFGLEWWGQVEVAMFASVFPFVCACVHVCVCVRVCVCAYIHACKLECLNVVLLYSCIHTSLCIAGAVYVLNVPYRQWLFKTLRV